MLITRPDQVRAAFAHPDLVPPPAGPGAAFSLRSRVARFSHGPDHERRRALAQAVIASIDPSAAARRAATLVRGGSPVREAVVRSLGLVPEGQVRLVLEVAGAYFDPSLPAPSLDVGDEEAAARLGVLVQACDATAVLVEQGMRPRGRRTKRLALRDLDLEGTPIPAGTTIVLELGDLIFGAPPRECPGRELAVAIAEAILAEVAR
jgi:cytochrome P450